jgi:ketosteroid isomerase-like protein
MKSPMNPRRLAPCLIALALIAVARPLSAQDNEKLHVELRTINSLYESAINSGDLTQLAPLFTPATSGVVVNNQEFKTLAELQDIYVKFHAAFPDTTYHIKMVPDRSQIFGDIAVAHGKCEESVVMPRGTFNYTSTWTAVLKRDNGAWTLVRSQVTMDPFDSPIVKFMVRKAQVTYGLIGLGAGLILGLVLSRVLDRQKT